MLDFLLACVLGIVVFMLVCLALWVVSEIIS